MSNTKEIGQLSFEEYKKLRLQYIQEQKAIFEKEEAELKKNGSSNGVVRSLKTQIKKSAKATHAIRQVLKENPGGLTNEEIADLTGFPMKTIQPTTSRLKNKGELSGETLEGGKMKYTLKK